MVFRPKAHLTQLFDNRTDENKPKLQFAKMFTSLNYKYTGLKSAEQQMLNLFIDRMQTSFKTGYFDKVEKRYYIKMCNNEISEATGDGLGTVSSKLKHLSNLGYIDIVRVKNHTSKIFLNFYHTGALSVNNDFEYHIFLPSNSKIEDWKFKNRMAEIQKSKTNQSTYPYLRYLDVDSNRLESTKDNRSNNNVVSNSKDNSNKDSIDYSIDNKKSNNKNVENQKQLNSNDNVVSNKEHKDIIEQLKMKEQHALPNKALDIIEDYVRSLNHSIVGNKDIMEKYIDRIFWAKDDASEAYDAKDILTWENTPQMIKDFNSQINRFLILSNEQSDRTWKGYFYKCVYNFFVEAVKKVKGDNNPKFTYTKQKGFSKVKNQSNNQKHIVEKKPKWAETGYKRRVKFDDQSSNTKKLIINKWNKMSWKERNNDTRYIEIDEKGLPYADSKGEFNYMSSVQQYETIYNSLIKIGYKKEELTNKLEDINRTKRIQNSYKFNAKDIIGKDLKQNNKSTDNKNIDKQNIDKQNKSNLSPEAMKKVKEAEAKFHDFERNNEYKEQQQKSSNNQVVKEPVNVKKDKSKDNKNNVDKESQETFNNFLASVAKDNGMEITK